MIASRNDRLFWLTCSLVPRLRKDIFDTRLKLIELPSIQSEGTLVMQRLLRR